MMKMLRKKRKGGFTLIELIVVIAILGILAAIAVPRFSGFQARSEKRAAEAEAKIVYTALVTMNSDGVTVNNTITAATPALVTLTGPLDGTLAVTDYENFTYTTSAAKGGVVATCTDGVITTP